MRLPEEEYESLEEHFGKIEDAKSRIFDDWDEGYISTGKARRLGREADPSFEKIMKAYNAGC